MPGVIVMMGGDCSSTSVNSNGGGEDQQHLDCLVKKLLPFIKYWWISHSLWPVKEAAEPVKPPETWGRPRSSLRSQIMKMSHHYLDWRDESRYESVRVCTLAIRTRQSSLMMYYSLNDVHSLSVAYCACLYLSMDGTEKALPLIQNWSSLDDSRLIGLWE